MIARAAQAADVGEPERRWEEPERSGGAGGSQASGIALIEQNGAAKPIGGSLGWGRARTEARPQEQGRQGALRG